MGHAAGAGHHRPRYLCRGGRRGLRRTGIASYAIRSPRRNSRLPGLIGRAGLGIPYRWVFPAPGSCCGCAALFAAWWWWGRSCGIGAPHSAVGASGPGPGAAIIPVLAFPLLSRGYRVIVDDAPGGYRVCTGDRSVASLWISIGVFPWISIFLWISRVGAFRAGFCQSWFVE